MEVIYYGGLFKQLGIFKNLILSKKNIIYFDYDISKSSMKNLFMFTAKTNPEKLVVNLTPTISKFDILDLSLELSDLEKNVGNLIITSPNDLFTFVMRKYIMIRNNKEIKFAFNCVDNVDKDSYFVCSSVQPLLSNSNNVKKVILDDRNYGNEGFLYNRLNIKHDDVSIITSKHFVKTKSMWFCFFNWLINKNIL